MWSALNGAWNIESTPEILANIIIIVIITTTTTTLPPGSYPENPTQMQG